MFVWNMDNKSLVRKWVGRIQTDTTSIWRSFVGFQTFDPDVL